MAETPYIFNIQKFSTHDGDGVRTTIISTNVPPVVDVLQNVNREPIPS